MLNDLDFKTTCNIRPHFVDPMGGLKIEGPLYMSSCLQADVLERCHLFSLSNLYHTRSSYITIDPFVFSYSGSRWMLPGWSLATDNTCVGYELVFTESTPYKWPPACWEIGCQLYGVGVGAVAGKLVPSESPFPS